MRVWGLPTRSVVTATTAARCKSSDQKPRNATADEAKEAMHEHRSGVLSLAEKAMGRFTVSQRRALVEGVLGFESSRTQQLARAIAGEDTLPKMPQSGSVATFLSKGATASERGKDVLDKGAAFRKHSRPPRDSEDKPVKKVVEALESACRHVDRMEELPKSSSLRILHSSLASLASLSDAARSGALRAAATKVSRMLPVDPKQATVARIAEAVVTCPLLQEVVLAAVVAYTCQHGRLSDASRKLAIDLTMQYGELLNTPFREVRAGIPSDVTTPVDGAVLTVAWRTSVCEELTHMRRSLPSSAELYGEVCSVIDAAIAREAEAVQEAVATVADTLLQVISGPLPSRAERNLGVAMHACRAVLRIKPVDSSQMQPPAGRLTGHSLLASHVTLLCMCLAVVIRTQAQERHSLTRVSLAADLLEKLWLAWLQPSLDAARTSHAHVMNHRTIHSALNADLVALRQDLTRHCGLARRGKHEKVSLSMTDGFYGFWLQHDGVAELLVSSMNALLESCRERTIRVSPPSATSSSTAGSHRVAGSREWVVACALILRTVLGLEAKLTFAASRALGMEWTVPTRIEAAAISTPTAVAEKRTNATASSGFPAKPAAMMMIENGKQGKWAKILIACDELRGISSGTVHTIFQTLVQHEMATNVNDDAGKADNGYESNAHANRNRRARHDSRLFLSMIRNAYFPLARRHYLCTQGFVRGDPRVHHAVLGPFADTFLLTRNAASVSPQLVVAGTNKSIPRYGEAAPGESADDLQACGTSLGQAIEVAFFLSFLVHHVDRWRSEAAAANLQRHVSPTSVTPISASAVQEYVAEALLALGASTAKQLWHLRSNGTLHHFTGQRRDRSLVTLDHVRRRHVQATLGVVHAHERHPSLLWMPLWQLQELVYLFERHRTLFYEPGEGSGVPAGSGSGEEAAGVGGDERASLWNSPSTGGADGGYAAGKGVPVALFLRAKRLGVDGSVVDLARTHGYLVLRLYVVSNVLRAYRDEVQARVAASCCSTSATLTTAAAAADANTTAGLAAGRRRDFAASLSWLAEREPASEKEKRRTHREWAKEIAESLLDEFGGLFSDAEGVVLGSTVLQESTASAQLSPISPRAVLRVLNRMESMVSRALASHLFLNVVADTRRRGLEALHINEAQRESNDVSETASAEGEGKLRPHSTIQLTMSRLSADVPLGFVLDASSATVTQVVGSDCATHNSPFSNAVRDALGAGVSATQYIGWRIVEVNGRAVGTGTLVAASLKGQLTATIVLASPLER